MGFDACSATADSAFTNATLARMPCPAVQALLNDTCGIVTPVTSVVTPQHTTATPHQAPRSIKHITNREWQRPQLMALPASPTGGTMRHTHSACDAVPTKFEIASSTAGSRATARAPRHTSSAHRNNAGHVAVRNSNSLCGGAEQPAQRVSARGRTVRSAVLANTPHARKAGLDPGARAHAAVAPIDAASCCTTIAATWKQQRSRQGGSRLGAATYGVRASPDGSMSRE